MSQSDIDQWSLAATQTLQQNQAEQLRNSVSQALPVNPDGEAQTRRFASAAGVPLDTARAMPDVVRQQAQMTTFDAGLLARKFPTTAQLLANPDNAKLLHDDIPATAQVEQAVRALPPATVPPVDPGTPPAPAVTMSSRLSDAIHYIFSTPGAGDTLVGDAGKVVSGGARALAGTAKYLTLAASTLDRPVDALLGTNTQEGALALTKSLDEYSQGGPTKQASFKDQLLNVVGSTGGVLLEAALTGGTSVEPRVGATVMEALRPHIAHGVQAMMVPSAVSAQDTYNSVIKETNDPVAASKAALASYVTSTLGGVVPFATPGKLAYRMASGAAMGPLLGDVSHTVVNAALPGNMQEPDRTWEDRGLDAVMGTMFGGLAGPKDVANMHQRIGDVALQTYADAIKTQADVQSIEALHGLGQVSAIAKLRERDPAAFKQFVDQVSDDGHLKDVYLDPTVLAKAFQQSGVTDADLQAAMPDLPGRLHEALETKGDVRLSVADYATHIAGTPIDDAILPHLKTDPEGRTYSEAQTFYQGQVESLKAEADKIIAQTDDATAARAARDGIRDQVLNQLNEVNRFSSQVNRPHAELMADYYTTMAQRAGMTPEQFMQTYALQYRSDATGGADKTLQQDTIAASGEPSDLRRVHETVPGEQLSATTGTGSVRGSGRVRGSDGLLAEPGRQEHGDVPRRESDGSLNGLPRKVGNLTASVFKPAADVAERYMADRGETYSPPTNYVKVDPARATRIADAFEAMEHDPRNPKVKAAYDAMINETVAQYEAMLKTGIKIEFAPKDTDPYNDNPRNMTEDVRNNNHMWVFSTRDGFGSDGAFDSTANPLWAETGHTISGQTALANDLFRAVHDYFGHVKEGVGFRADGEENAWRAHAAMYSDLARKAATTETRGQNSWLNYGPYGETNRTAKVGDTHFADQKIGLLPDWAWTEGFDAGHPDTFDQAQPDMFDQDFATKQTTVDIGVKISSKGDTLQGGNVDSAGQQITATKQGLKNFWKWFGQSEAVNEKGEPLVLYHSTKADVDVLKDGQKTSNNYGLLGDVDLTRSGIFLSPDRDFSQEYLRSGDGQNVMQLYAHLEKPLDLRNGMSVDVERELVEAGVSSRWLYDYRQHDWEMFDNADDGTNHFVDTLKKLGYDGAVFHEQGQDEKTHETYVVFDGSQLKSATGNSGEFDPKNPSILKQEARGQVAFGDDITKQPSIISMFKGADLSTFLHESGHFFLEVQADLARKIEARIAAGEDVGPGERSIADDMATSLDWLGVKASDGKTAMDKWNGMTLEEKRELHEKWARGFETYAMEGTAPSVGLARAFQTFSNWLTHIYKTLTNLHAELTPEVRAVFDRMLASQDAIQTAEAVRGYKSLFETADAAGMTPEAFAEYQKLGQQSTSDAIATMQARSLRDMKWLSNAKSRVLKDLQAKASAARRDMREQVTKEVDATPAFAAKRFLDEATDPLAGYKSDMADWRAKRNEVPKGERDAWVKANPEPAKPRTDLDAWSAARQVAEDAVRAEEKAKVTEGLKGLEKGQALAKNKRAIDNRVDAAMIKWDGENRRPENSKVKVDMQIVADKFGFDTPDDMLAAIHDAGSRKEAIEGLTDQRMLEQHGDLIDARSVERAAEAAIHNEARARFMATGLKALTKSPTPAAMIHEAARQAADAAVNAKRIGDLRPSQYAAAEAKNNREALKLAPKDTDGAIKAQQAALLNNQLFKRATDAANFIEKSLRYLKKFDKPTIRENLDGAFLERIDQIRATLDLRRTPSETNPSQEALITWADGLRKLGYEPQIADWLNAMNTPMHYKDATVQQFQQVVDAVKSLDHIAREMKQITIDGKKIAVDEAVATLSKRMDQRGVKFTKQELLEKPTAKVDGIWAATTNWIAVHMRMVHADLLPPEYKINKFDLHELDGPFRQMILDPILAGNYRKVDMTKRQSDRAARVGDTLGKDWQHTLYDGVSNKTLLDPELSTPGAPVFFKMTRGRMLGIARHVGNESNFEKLTKGYGWKGEDVWAFLDKNMTEKDWAATQAHWDSFDPLWHESEAMIRRQGGVPPPKIPAREFDTRFGKMKGGYSPIDYDPLRSKLAVRQGEFDLGPGDKVGEQMNYRATTTHNSSLVARSQGYSDRINLDFHSAEGRIRDTIHDLAYREALLDVGKIVNNAKFRDQFMQTYGREEYQALNDWLGGVRDMNSSDPRNRGFEKAMQYGRQGVVLTGIGYRISTVAKHGGAAALKSLGYLGNAEGAKYFAVRVARMASGHMQEDLAGAREKFPEIRARLLQMDRDYKVGNRSMYESEGWKEKNDRFGHAMVAWSDALSATPTAWAAYDLAKTSGVPVSMGGTGKPMTEAQAVNYANSVVRQAHGSALESTRSNFMQAGSIKGFFGALYGFMNNTYGQSADMLDKAISGGYFKNNPAVAARLLATLLIPAVWTQWLKDSGPGAEESTFTWAGKAIAGEVGAMVPFVRDAVSLLEYGRSSQIAPLQMVTDLTTSAKDFWDEAHGHQTRLVQDLSNTIGEWAHIAGLGQLGHILQYLRDVENGKKHPDGAGQAVKEAVIGGAHHK